MLRRAHLTGELASRSEIRSPVYRQSSCTLEDVVAKQPLPLIGGLPDGETVSEFQLHLVRLQAKQVRKRLR